VLEVRRELERFLSVTGATRASEEERARLLEIARAMDQAGKANLISELRRIGIRVDIDRLDFPVFIERRTKGEFDLDLSVANMDPSPSGIVQSWSCAGRGGSNVGWFCNPGLDSLLERSIYSQASGGRYWQAAYARLQGDVPAVFLASPAISIAVHGRFRNVSIRPESMYGDLWRWSVDPGRRISRDGTGATPR